MEVGEDIVLDGDSDGDGDGDGENDNDDDDDDNLFEDSSRWLSEWRWEKTSSWSHRDERSLLQRLSLKWW